ncbi:sigma-70 family RNA polymerase sigma factor [Sphingosinicella sp. LHD-64]|uniref:RNA polymerase sigma factor n=1 Tax=Sphingosinicella sp. LHD-64 TaxID=3072139 RepID=UPI00280F0D34|nr:sigma-70 family RNA polymerase sigma factor [Sphingosinicella sp. LHD-64]MDQ8756240.1 sigma-70 family RNA polymerase sigma factor [Sphingosinicella sp. LHD-64]
MSDAREVARGDALAAAATLERLYEEEAPRLLRYFRRRTGNCPSAADMVQDAFLRLASIGRASEVANPGAYLQRIARNLVIDRVRADRLSRRVYVPLEDQDAPAPATQEDGMIAADLLRLYEQVVAELPERTRTIFLLQRAEGMTYRQIAERLGVPLWTVEHHMKRAIAHIDRSFEKI